MKQPPRLLVDMHLDLAMNALDWNRDYQQEVAAIRLAEQGRTDKPDRGKNTVSLPELQRAGVRLCVATQIARYSSPGHPLPGWQSPALAWAHTQAQLAWYREMERVGWLRQIQQLDQLEAHLQAEAARPVGYVLSLEGADSLVTLDHLHIAYEYGLRALGPAHYGPGRYAPGTGARGGLTAAGRALLREMGQLGMILDVTHLTDEGFWEAMDLFPGSVWASHSNCRALVPDQRQLSDDMIGALLQRQAIIGVVLDAWMLSPGWERGKSSAADRGLRLAQVVDHIDHICQLAGDTRHVAIGSDLDGGFGTEQVPADLDTIADLQSLDGLLADWGYSAADREAIFSGNVIRFLRKAWGGS